jgi:hypothetical protein
MPDSDGYLMRFTNGPLSKRANIKTLAGTTGNTVVPRALFGWPLPRRLCVLAHAAAENAAMWDADKPPPAGLPPEITESPNRVIYVKTSESQLPEDVEGVVRGAEYELQTAAPA